jgi:UDP-glucose:(glucosyl)LPS alpha-1,2-glucosyltransferase
VSLSDIKESEKIDISPVGPSSDGTYADAKGGTEMMAERISAIVSELGLDDEVNIIHSRVRELSSNKKNILVLHDLWSDPEVAFLKDPAKRAKFEKLVFVSNQQFQTYHLALGIPYSEAHIMRNAIDPINPKEPKPNPTERINLIYHTTPHRGLELLVPCFNELARIHGDLIHLDVYSSFNAYGWGHRDEPYEPLFDTIRNHPQMTYHGYQPNDVVRDALEKAHIFAYPNIWQETSCIAVMEAMSAGVDVVCPNHAALYETTAGFVNMYQYHEDPNQHAAVFINQLHNSILYCKEGAHLPRINHAKNYVDNLYSWDYRKHEWEHFLKGLTSAQ